MLCCLDVQLQWLVIGVTTKSPDSGPVPQLAGDIYSNDQYWYVVITNEDCRACHKGQGRIQKWYLDRSPGNTFGVAVSEKGELHLYHNGRDMGVAWEGLPTNKPLWGFVGLEGGWKMLTNYMIAEGESVTCGKVVCVVLYCIVLLRLPLQHKAGRMGNVWCDVLCKVYMFEPVNCECV